MDLSKQAEFIAAHSFECVAWDDQDCIIVFGTSWNPETQEEFNSILHYSEDGIKETMVSRNGDTDNYYGGDYKTTRDWLGY